MFELILDVLLKSSGPGLVLTGQIEDGVQVGAHEIVQPGDNDPAQILFDILGGQGGDRADEGVDEQKGLDDPDVEHAVGP